MELTNDITEQIKQSEEYISYINAKQALKDVSKGGELYHECSFMDISVRMDRAYDRKKELITFLGTLVLDEMEKSKDEN